MWHRILAVTLAAGLGAWLSSAADAVSFGGIRIVSHLGEPFYAEIPLTMVGSSEGESMVVSIGTSSDYQVLEAFRDPVVGQLKPRIATIDGELRVVVSSETALEAPFFNLLLKIDQNSGAVYRNFPVLLDPPASTAMSAPVIQPTARPAATTPAVQPQQQTPVTPAPRPGIVAVAPVGAVAPVTPDGQVAVAPVAPAGDVYNGWARTDKYGPTQRGDTLFEIARRLRKDESLTLQQVVVALFQANPDNFVDGNMHTIKKGSWFKVPERAEVAALSHQGAVAEISRQMKEWDRTHPRYTVKMVVQDQASGMAAKTPAPDAGQHSGEEGSGKSDETSQAQNQSSAAPTPTATLDAASRQELAHAEEEAAALRSKLDDLVAQIAAQNEARDKEMAMLRGQLKAAALGRPVSTEEAGLFDDSILLVGALGGVCLALAGLGFVVWQNRKLKAELAAIVGGNFEFEAAQVVATPVGEGIALVQPGAVHAEAQRDDGSERTMMLKEPMLGVGGTAAAATPELDEISIETKKLAEGKSPDDLFTQAEIFFNYGMEDDALDQLKAGLVVAPEEQRFYEKMLAIYEARGDAAGMESVIRVAQRNMGGALSQSTKLEWDGRARTVKGGGAPSLEDSSASLQTVALGAVDSGGGLDLDGFNLDFGSDETGVGGGSSDVPADADEFDLSSMMVADEPPKKSAAPKPAAQPEGFDFGGDLELDLSDMDLSGLEPLESNAGSDATQMMSATQMGQMGDGLELDLDGMDLSGLEAVEDEGTMLSEISTEGGVELDLTGMDLSGASLKSDEVDMSLFSEAGEGDMELDLNGLDMNAATTFDADATVVGQAPEEGVDLDLTGMDLSGASLGGSEAEADLFSEAAEGEMDLDLGGLDLEGVSLPGAKTKGVEAEASAALSESGAFDLDLLMNHPEPDDEEEEFDLGDMGATDIDATIQSALAAKDEETGEFNALELSLSGEFDLTALGLEAIDKPKTPTPRVQEPVGDEIDLDLNASLDGLAEPIESDEDLFGGDDAVAALAGSADDGVDLNLDESSELLMPVEDEEEIEAQGGEAEFSQAAITDDTPEATVLMQSGADLEDLDLSSLLEEHSTAEEGPFAQEEESPESVLADDSVGLGDLDLSGLLGSQDEASVAAVDQKPSSQDEVDEVLQEEMADLDDLDLSSLVDADHIGVSRTPSEITGTMVMSGSFDPSMMAPLSDLANAQEGDDDEEMHLFDPSSISLDACRAKLQAGGDPRDILLDFANALDEARTRTEALNLLLDWSQNAEGKVIDEVVHDLEPHLEAEGVRLLGRA